MRQLSRTLYSPSAPLRVNKELETDAPPGHCSTTSLCSRGNLLTMSNDDSKTSKPVHVSSQHAFHLDKAQHSLFEAGKAIRGAAIAYLAFLFLSFLVVFFSGQSSILTIPGIGLPLDRRYAAEVCTVLSITSLFRLTAMMTYERILQFKVDELIENGFGSLWYLRYPGVWSFIHMLEEEPSYVKWIFGSMIVLYLTGHVVPGIILYRAGVVYLYGVRVRLA